LPAPSQTPGSADLIAQPADDNDEMSGLADWS
jgi:hypothetical protein